MAQVINTNISSLNAQRQLSKSGIGQQTAMERLSSGLRINSARDDAAGLAIADRMTSQIRGLNQAARNANDGISVAQVAEGALGEITANLQRMRELAVQAANDTNTATDRASIQKEVSQLQQEVNRIATQTQFNGKGLLDGTFLSQKFQIGAYAEQTISISIGNATATSIGNHTVTATGTLNNATVAAAAYTAASSPVVTGENLTVSGSLGTAVVDVADDATARDIATQINSATATTGVTASAVTKAKLDNVSAADTFSFTLFGSNTTGVSITANIASTSDLSGLRDAINAKAGATGITAELDSAGAVILTQAEGYNIGVEGVLSVTAGKSIDLTGLDGSLTEKGAAAVLGAAVGTDSSMVGGTLEFASSTTFSVTSAAAGGVFSATTANASALASVGAATVGTQSGANSAIKAIDGALGFVDDLRATLGSISNRFSSAISAVQSTAENVSAARSRIQDADFASETAELSRTQILQQAGTAMLAQANASVQNVLQLLQG